MIHETNDTWKDWNLVSMLSIQNKNTGLCKFMGLIVHLRAAKRPLRGAKGPTFLFIKIESWNLVRINWGEWYGYICVLTILWTMKRPLRRAEGPPFQNYFIYLDKSLKFRMHTAQIKWNPMIVATGDKTDNRWRRLLPGNKLTMGDGGVQRVTMGDDGVKVQKHVFYPVYPATLGNGYTS